MKRLLVILILASSVSALAATEDFTTYTHQDTTELTITATKVSWDELDRDADVWCYADKGAAHFAGDFTHTLDVQLIDMDATSIAYNWVLSNAVDDWTGLDAATGEAADAYGLRSYYDGSIRTLTLRMIQDSAVTSDTSVALADSTTYYLTITRDDDGGANGTGQLTCEIHTGALHPGGAHVDLLSLDSSAGEQNDFRYIFACNCHNSGGSNIPCDGYTENLDLNEAAPPAETESVHRAAMLHNQQQRRN
jgi:hypothetical protein